MKTTKETHYVYKITNLLEEDESKKYFFGISATNSTEIEMSTCVKRLKIKIEEVGLEYFEKEIVSDTLSSIEEARKIKKRIYTKYYNKSHRNEISLKQRKYTQLNSEHISERAKKYREENKHEISKRRSGQWSLIKDDVNKKRNENRTKENILNDKQKYIKQKMKIVDEKIKMGLCGDDWVFYTIQFTHTNGISFFKYGITSLNTMNRYKSGYSDYLIEIIDEMYGDEEYIKSVERKHLLEGKKDIFIFSNGMTFKNGKTECRTKLVSALKIV
ncbi:MAG: hypothetical protein DRH57_06960 [Candidatus Cloacimonadota bacterium]|nr:MAG: hypothetical protein DRH57_06960 [Candidatus Cloacimonadota bacterium]